jgi:hypothetical protein
MANRNRDALGAAPRNLAGTLSTAFDARDGLLFSHLE